MKTLKELEDIVNKNVKFLKNNSDINKVIDNLIKECNDKGENNLKTFNFKKTLKEVKKLINQGGK